MLLYIEEKHKNLSKWRNQSRTKTKKVEKDKKVMLCQTETIEKGPQNHTITQEDPQKIQMKNPLHLKYCKDNKTNLS